MEHPKENRLAIAQTCARLGHVSRRSSRRFVDHADRVAASRPRIGIRNATAESERPERHLSMRMSASVCKPRRVTRLSEEIGK